MAIQLPQMPTIPRSDFSWMNNLVSTVGDAIDKRVAGDLIAESLSGANKAPQAPQAPMPTGLQGLAPQAQQPQTVTNIPVSRGPAQGSTYEPFINTVRGGGLTNPYGLSAVAAYGKAESGWSSDNANRTWADPSESGQAGTSGGILSWRGPRLASLQSYAASKGEQGNGSPQTQAEFFLQENPQVVQALNNAKSPQEANSILANAWKFAGYDRPGGENARRAALTQNYYANEFANSPATNGGAAAIEAIAPQGGFDSGRFAAAAPVAQGAEDLAAALSAPPDAAPAYRDPMVNAQGGNPPASAPAATAAPVQPNVPAPVPVQASPESNVLAGATQLTRQNVDPDIIRRMVQNPITRQLGLALAQQTLGGGKTGEPWQFIKLANGDLARANQQTGAIERVGNFGKEGGEGEAGLSLVYGQDENGNTIAWQPLKSGGLRRVEIPEGAKLTPGVNNVDTGTAIVTQNTKTGQVIQTRQKDVAGVADQTATGKNNAEARAALPQVEGAANRALASIDSLYNDPYLANVVGPINSRTPELTADAARVRGKIDQIGGQSFLQAFESLRGGGAITEVEGVKATQAIQRLNEAQSYKDYRAALKELRDIVTVGVERARQKAAGGNAASSDNSTAIQSARDAIARGAPREAVIQRLKDNGISTEGL